MAQSLRGDLHYFPEELKVFNSDDLPQNMARIKSDLKHERVASMVRSKPPHAQVGTSKYIYNYFYGLNLEQEEEDQVGGSELSGKENQYFQEDDQKKQKRLSNCMTYIFLLKGYVAVGILTLSVGFRQSGDLLASIFIVISGILSTVGARMLIQSRQVVPLSFSGISEMAYGRWLKLTTDILIVVSQTGFVTGFVGFFSLHIDVIVKWLSGQLDNPNKIVSKWYVALGCFVLETFLCWIRKIEVFAKCYLFANACIVIGVLLILSQSFVQIGEGHLGEEPNVIYGHDWFALLGFIGNSVYMFEGIGIIIPVYESVEKKKDFVKILSLLILNLVIAFIIFGFATELAFTSTILPSHSFVTQTLNQNYKNRWYNYILQFAWLLSLIPQFPLTLYPAVRILQKCLFGKYRGSVTKRKWMKNIFRTFWLALAIIIATIFEQTISKILGIVGAIACTPIAFTIPALLHLKLVAKTSGERCCDWFMIILSLFILVFATTFNIITVTKEL